MRRLRGLRIGLAAVVLLLFALAFLGPLAVQAPLADGLPRLQGGVAVYRLLAAGTLGAVLSLTAIAAVTLLAGRVYCAFWCPLGVLQDGIRFLARRLPWLRRWQDRPPQATRARWRQLARWAILTAVLGSAAVGFGALAAALEPYSAFGRIVTHLARPLAGLAREGLAAGLERIDVYALSGSEAPWPTAAGGLAVAASLGALAVLAALGGRLYCTAICPVGTVLGLLARTAPVRVRVDASACTRCGLCARRCRAGSIQIDAEGVRVDPATCVACMDCLTLCPVDGVRYSGPAPGRHEAPAEAGRRELLAAGSSAALALLAQPARLLAGGGSVGSDLGPVAPPGAGSRERFADCCTACQLCVTACPSHVLQPALLEYGAAGILQPRLSFTDGFCEYDCKRCTEVCPTGALRPLTLPEKQRTQLGIARLHKPRCIVYCRGEECGACAEVCPTRAVYTVDLSGLLCPETAPGSCIGCGACEYACPQFPKAIEVQACDVHGHAAEPHVPESSAEQAPETAPAAGSASSDFPF